MKFNKLFRSAPVCVCLAFLSCLSCSRETALERALTLAGDNRHELEQVLRHYEGDSLKWEAARFLIENMPYHFYLEEFYSLPGGGRYRPQLSDFHTDEAYTRQLDSLARAGCPVKTLKHRDVQTLDSAFLVRNIDLAFEAWEKPWARQVPFSVFCRYILPYRTSREYPSGLRKAMMERFIPLLDSAGVASPLEACVVLNERLGGVMRYIKNTLPFYPTIEETYAWGGGQCEGMCDLGLFIMRAAGIPVAMDQTVWTRMDWGHNWGAVWHEGRFLGFAPGEHAPEDYLQILNEGAKLRPAKVYRSHFEPDPAYQKEATDEDGYVSWLKSPLLEDVTTEYLERPIDIRVATDCMREFPRRSGPVYLCAYNYYKWEPVATGCRTDSVCLFRQVGGNNIFIAADSPAPGQLRFITAPFYVDTCGTIRKFIPHPERTSTFTFSKRRGFLDRPYTLRYWDVESASFVLLEYECTTERTQTYTNIPENALLWFTLPDRIVNQRVFYLEEGRIITMEMKR